MKHGDGYIRVLMNGIVMVDEGVGLDFVGKRNAICKSLCPFESFILYNREK